MPNVLGALTSNLIVQEALDLVFTKRPILKSFSLDLSANEEVFNQTVTTRVYNIPAVNNFATGAVDTNYTDVPVTINQFKEVHYAFTPQELSGTNRRLQDEAAEAMAVAIGNHLVDAVAANWTAANFPTNTVVASGWNYTNTLVPLRGVLTGRGVKDSGRFLVTNTAVYNSLLTDTLIVGNQNNSNDGGAIMSGYIPQVTGFGSIQEYPAIPTAGSQVGFAGTPDTAIVCMRLPVTPTELGVAYPGQYENLTAENGISVAVNRWINPVNNALNVRLLLMYGTAKGNANNGQRLTTA